MMEPLAALLARDAAWRPSPGEVALWGAEADRAGAPPELLHERRWWQAHAAALCADWDRVTALAQEGLGEPFSEREALRIALLHAMSGDLEQTEHVIAQAVQWRGDESLPRRFAEICAAEGLAGPAARFRKISGIDR